LDKFFEKVNQKHESMGVNWSVKEGHYWIECKITRDIDRMGTTPT
jgi:hypothetical protein